MTCLVCAPQAGKIPMRARSSRRQSKDPLERYDTQPWMVRALIATVPHLTTQRRVIEPCAGAGAIARVLEDEAGCTVHCADLEPRAPYVMQFDTLGRPWTTDGSRPVITNGPFSRGGDLFWRCLEGNVPYLLNLLRLNFLERVPDRDDVLDPDWILVLPRIQPWFTGRKADSLTVAWMLWVFDLEPDSWPRGITRLGKDECRQYVTGPVDRTCAPSGLARESVPAACRCTHAGPGTVARASLRTPPGTARD